MGLSRFDTRGAEGDPPAVDRVPGPTLRDDRRATTTRRWLIALTLAALASRLLWVLVIHPPGDYVFSDMGKYVDRAREVAITGWSPAPLEEASRREWAWQAFG